MTAKFQVLEVARYIGHKAGKMSPAIVRYIGQLCVITDPLGCYEGVPLLRYGVRFADEQDMWVTECSLEKYRAPEHQVQKFRDELKQAGKSFGQIINDCKGAIS